MKFLKSLGIFLLAVASCAAAAPTDKPTTESVEKLLHVMKADEMMTTMQKSMKGMLDQMYSNPALVGELTPEKKAAIAKIEDKMVADMNGFLSWDNVKEITINAYQASFTQKEVDAITAFYQTPEGQSIVTKLPAVMQSAMVQMQAKIQPMLQKMVADARASAAQLKAGNLAVDPSAAPAQVGTGS